jgi:hypothetical protein
MRWAAYTLLALVAVRCGFAAEDPDSLSRIREHMREYLARLPDYTCRVTVERSARRNLRAAYSVTDRLHLEIAYAGGHEFYAWPGDARFENTIEELLPERGLVSEGSWALHMRKLFLTNDAQFQAPRMESNELRVDFLVPAVRSGFSISAGGASAPAALQGSVWFDRSSLDVHRLEVRVEDTPRGVRIARTREVTSYAIAVVGDVPVVLPVTSELELLDRDGSERRNRSEFNDCHRYAGSATVRYDAASEPAAERSAPRETYKRGQRVDVKFESGIPADAAIGDLFTSGEDTVRITDIRQTGVRWSIEFTLVGTRAVVRKSLMLPAPPGTSLSFRVE